MELHADPEVHVASFARRHEESLSVYNAILHLAVQEAFARWEDRFEDPLRLRGDTLASSTRAIFYDVAEEYVNQARTLTLVPRASSRQLMSGSGDTVRIRRYPLNPTFAKPVGVIPAATEHLFGNSLADLVYELAILWVPDPRTKSLKVAYLAAVADIDEKPKIYARAELPPPAILNEETLKGIRLHKVEILDDFEDAFAREETGGDSLA